MMPLPNCVYILFSHKDHNDGKTKSTAPRRPLELIFCEFCLFEADARKREMYFKTSAGKKAIKLMLGGTLLKFGYLTTARVVVTSED